MEYIQRLPLILSLLMAIIIGITAYINGDKNQNIYLKMAVCVLGFYVLGLYARNVIKKTIDEIEEKKEKQKESENENQKLQKQEGLKEKEKNAGVVNDISKMGGIPEINLQTDEDNFQPLKVSKVIKNYVSADDSK